MLKSVNLPPRLGFLRLFAGANMRLIGRLLSDQGKKHWKGYAFALVMTVIVAWTTTLSAWIMRDVINEIFVAKKLAAVWMIGGVIVAIYTVKGFATYGRRWCCRGSPTPSSPRCSGASSTRCWR